jgi:hypothetical protein
MSKFSDLLSRPLPSASSELFGNFLEETDDISGDMKDEVKNIDDLSDVDTPDDADASAEPEKNEGANCADCYTNPYGNNTRNECGSNCGSECGDNCSTGNECGDDNSDSIDDTQSIASDVADSDIEDIENMSDEELSALDAELSDDQFSSFANDEDEVTLTPAEQQEADDMMGIAATTVLVNDELNKGEKKKFIESTTDVKAAINEGLMLESDINEMAASLGLYTEGNNYNKKMIIRLDREAKQKQLYAIAVNVSAAAHNDTDYVKLKKLNRMRKIIRAKLDRKYHSEATRRMRAYYKRLVTSNSAPLAAIGKDLEKKDDK